MKTASKQNSERKNQVINDFGQKIGGAHKDRASEAAARLAGVDASALMLKPLAQVAKMPDFRALYLSGVITEDQARRGWYLWAQIGSKPTAQSWKVRGWAERAAALIESVANTLAYGVGEKSQIPEGLRPFQSLELFEAEMTAANWPADDYKRGAYFVGYYWTNPNKFSIHTAGKSECKAYLSVSECVDAIRAKVDKNAKKGRNPHFCVYTNRAGYWISPNGKPAIRLAECETSAEAWRMIADESEKLAQTFEELKKFPSERRDWNRPRLGADWRKGSDLNPQSFAAVFPFRGVEFGNWVNQLERAACLNECADALQDMAQVLGILPDAVTLGGSLAWAFGSRGIGKALAHYEPARRVINLTKKKGNGCVAHEWFHALDNYLMIKAGKPSLYMVGDCYAYGNTEKSPIFEAAEALKAALLKSDMYTRSKRIDEFKTKPYWATVVEMAARAFEAVIYYKLEAAGMCNDYLVNITPADEYSRSNCYPYPTREEAAQLAPLYDAFILAAFSEAERAPMVEASAYEDSEKSQILATLETIREAILNESVSYGEISYLQEHAEHIKPDDTLLLEWAGVPEYPEDEAPAVAASEPMNEDSTDPTPADGVQGAAYGDSEKSQNFEDFEELSQLLVHHQRMKKRHPEAVLLYRMGDFYEAYFQDSQTVADCLGITRRKVRDYYVAGFPSHALDVYLPKLIRAGHRVAICDDPRPLTRTNADGREESAYWNPEKSPIPEKLTREEQDSIAAEFGLVSDRHGFDGTLYTLKGADGQPVKNDKYEKMRVKINAHIELSNVQNSLPAQWQRDGYTREILTNWWSIDVYCTRPDGLCIMDYNPTILDYGKRFVVNFEWTLPITADNLRKLLGEVLKRFYGDCEKSQNSKKPRQKSVHDIYMQFCRLRDELTAQCYPLDGVQLARMNKILEVYERYVSNVHKFMDQKNWDNKKPFAREFYMLYRRPDVAQLNKEMRICELNELEFVDDGGKVHRYGRGSYAFFVPKKGWVSMPDGYGLPYVNSLEVLKGIQSDGGFLNFDGFKFVWPLMKGYNEEPKRTKPESISKESWLALKVQGMKVPKGFRQYVYEFIEKSLNPAPDGVEWGIRTDSLWGIWLKVDGVIFTAAYTHGRERIYFDIVDTSNRFPNEIVSPISWCNYLDIVLSENRIAMSWPTPYQFYAIEGYMPMEGSPMFVG